MVEKRVIRDCEVEYCDRNSTFSLKLVINYILALRLLKWNLSTEIGLMCDQETQILK